MGDNVQTQHRATAASNASHHKRQLVEWSGEVSCRLPDHGTQYAWRRISPLRIPDPCLSTPPSPPGVPSGCLQISTEAAPLASL